MVTSKLKKDKTSSLDKDLEATILRLKQNSKSQINNKGLNKKSSSKIKNKTTSTKIKQKKEKETSDDIRITENNNKDNNSINDIFKKHFESQYGKFGSKKNTKKVKKEKINIEKEKENDVEFKGFDDEIEDQPVVVQFTEKKYEPEIITNRQKKLLLGSKTPVLEDLDLNNTEKDSSPKEKDDEENLENDLALQRLLEESHILSESMDYSGTELLNTIDYEDPIGKLRQNVIRNRIKSIGGKDLKNEKMSMDKRKGIIEHRKNLSIKYEKEAKEGGIILSKKRKNEIYHLDGSIRSQDTGKKNLKNKFRERGLKIQSVGKSTNRGLVISQREIDKYTSSNGPTGKKKRRH